MQDGALTAAFGSELTDAERGLLHALSAGDVADLRGETVRSTIVTDLALGRRPDARLCPAGIRIANGGLSGKLDLADAQLPVPLVLQSMIVGDAADGTALRLEGADVAKLVLQECEVEGDVAAAGVHIRHDLSLRGTTVHGRIDIDHARIGGRLQAERAVLGNGEQALSGVSSTIGAIVCLDAAQLSGRVDLARAQLQLGLTADGMRLSGQSSPFSLEMAHLDGALVLDHATCESHWRFANVRVAGPLSAGSARVAARGTAIDISGAQITGAICLDRAVITGSVSFDGAKAAGGVIATALRIDGDMTALSATDSQIASSFNLTAARLTGRLDLTAATIDGDLIARGLKVFGSDLAVRADRMTLTGELKACEAMMVGRMSMQAARCAHGIDFRDANLKVEAGVALDAARANIGGDIDLGDGLQTLGGITLEAAKISGMCDLDGARVKSASIANDIEPGDAGVAPQRRANAAAHVSPDEIALSFRHAQIGHLRLPRNLAQRPRGIVDFTNARITEFEDAAETWPPEPLQRARAADGRDIDHLVLAGLTFDRLISPAGDPRADQPTAPGAQRLRWLAGQRADIYEAAKDPQPWTHLARYFAAEGLREDADFLNRDLRRRQRGRPTGVLSQAVAALREFAAAFGRSVTRAAALLAVILVMATMVFSWAASQCSAPGCANGTVYLHTPQARSSKSGSVTNAAAPARFNAVLFALDRTLPIVRLAPAAEWQVNLHWAPLATFRVPDIPVFLSGETDKDSLYTQITITAGGLLYALELLFGVLGACAICLAVLSLARRVLWII